MLLADIGHKLCPGPARLCWLEGGCSGVTQTYGRGTPSALLGGVQRQGYVGIMRMQALMTGLYVAHWASTVKSSHRKPPVRALLGREFGFGISFIVTFSASQL